MAGPLIVSEGKIQKALSIIHIQFRRKPHPGRRPELRPGPPGNVGERSMNTKAIPWIWGLFFIMKGTFQPK